MKTNKLVLIGGLVIALQVGGTAHAAPAEPATRVFIANGVLHVVGQTGVNNTIAVSRAPGQLNQVQVDDFGKSVATAAPCVNVSVSRVSCPFSALRQVVVNANDGKDVIENHGTDLPTRLLAGEGDDFVIGSFHGETIDLGPGNDRAMPRLGTDLVSGGDGTDQVWYTDRQQDVIIQLDGLANDGEPGENDQILSDVESLIGGHGNDRLIGNDIDNEIHGMSGNDFISLGGGDDLANGESGADTFLGGSGTDTVSYIDRSTPVQVIIDDIARDGGQSEGDDVRSDIENLTGGGGDDALVGNDQANLIVGSGGNDTLIGREGDDILIGNSGQDHALGGPGVDRCDAEVVFDCP